MKLRLNVQLHRKHDNAMVIGQLGGNLLGGAMSHWVGLENVFFVSAASIML